MNWLTRFPDSNALLNRFSDVQPLSVNAHVHTPYSFSAFNDIPEIFRMAKKEHIAAIGINDFFVTDGFRPFHDEAMKTGIFPLFNIEFIGLLKKEQEQNIRINDPNNPGRCYFCGKGLSFPFKVDPPVAAKLNSIVSSSQDQMRAMIDKINMIFRDLNAGITLSYEEIKSQYAINLVRERHLAKAIRIAVKEKYIGEGRELSFLTQLFEGKPPKSLLSDIPGLENEIRANMLKSGGKAFVEEDENTFLSLDEIIEIILNARGIPCYPVLLDDRNGNYTEFESSPENLYQALNSKNIGCIELIPGRNDAAHLEKFITFFHAKGFIILLGTEHNTPDMIPLTCDTRGKIPLNDRIRQIAYEGVCVVAAHQYLTSRGSQAFLNENGKARISEIPYFIKLGNALIHHQKQIKV